MSTRPPKPITDPERADAVIRIVHPDMAALKLGMTVAEVLARRIALGLPPVQEQFAKTRQGRSRECD